MPAGLITPRELAIEFQRLNDYLTSDVGPDRSKQRLVDLACEVIPGCRWAAITAWPDGAPPRTVSSSGGVPQDVDRIQYETGQGPCLSAARADWTAWSPDLRRETRWPAFVAAAMKATPVRGALSLHLSGLEGNHALNLYSDRAGDFDQEAVAVGALFASHARVLMAHANASAEAESLRHALTTSRSIGTAIGVIMATYQVDQEVAFQVLRRTSNQLNRKVRDVAGQVNRTGRLPRSTPEAGRTLRTPRGSVALGELLAVHAQGSARDGLQARPSDRPVAGRADAIDARVDAA